MSSSKKSKPTRARRPQEPHSHPLVRHLAALDALGWRVVELEPSFSSGGPTFWRTTAERFDREARLVVTEADPDVALAELVRYASADAPGAR